MCPCEKKYLFGVFLYEKEKVLLRITKWRIMGDLEDEEEILKKKE